MRKAPVIGLIVISALLIILVAACKSGTSPSATPGVATMLVFTAQPAGATAGAPFTTQPVVAVEDTNGNTVTTSTAPVTLAITSGTGATGAVLSGTATVNAVNGVATFTGLSIDLVGTGYTLTATSSGLTAATSSTFDVAAAPTPTPVAGPAAKLAFVIQPSKAIVGVPFTGQPIVEVQDANGNTASTSTAPVTLAITPGTGASGAVLSGTTTVNATNGGAIFSDLSINMVGTGYTLTATSPGLTSATSNAFDVTVPPTPTPEPGVAAKLVFTTQPGGATAGKPFTTQPVVTVEDASGNVVASSRASITLTITQGTGTSGAVLSGTTTVSEVNGVATFTNLAINLAGTGYTLTATRSGPLSVTSNAFDVGAAPTPAQYQDIEGSAATLSKGDSKPQYYCLFVSPVAPQVDRSLETITVVHQDRGYHHITIVPMTSLKRRPYCSYQHYPENRAKNLTFGVSESIILHPIVIYRANVSTENAATCALVSEKATRMSLKGGLSTKLEARLIHTSKKQEKELTNA